MGRILKHAGTGLYTTRKTATCNICNKTFNAKGIVKHTPSCLRKAARRAQEQEDHVILMEVESAEDLQRVHVAEEAEEELDVIDDNSDGGPDVFMGYSDGDFVPLDTTYDDLVNPQMETVEQPFDDCDSDFQPKLDDIRTEYHPHSALPARVDHFEEYGRQDDHPRPTSADCNPLADFGTRAEFDFAELALDASLNHPQIDRLLAIIDNIRNGAPFTFHKYGDVEAAWEIASRSHAGFEKVVITEEYKDETLSFDVYRRDVKQWALELIGNPAIAPHLHWDAERLYKRGSNGWSRFVHEPWTGDLWWEQQLKIPAWGKPVFFVIYADKTRLSSMGHAQGYPLMGALLNEPVDIRNGSGLGGGVILGWLPIVPEYEDKRRKKTFVNFKRTVYHKAVLVILESLLDHTKDGYAFKCGDGILRFLFFMILFLVADYEEQCSMALLRGLKGSAPCPICLVPRDEQHNLFNAHLWRDTEFIVSVVTDPTLTKTQKDAFLKSYGLRNIFNGFWNFPRFDVSRALCFDRLHANHIGLFKAHLWAAFKAALEELSRKGRSQKAAIDEQVAALPRWRDFNHFSAIIDVEFSDGSKFEDISKSLIFAAQHVITEDTCPVGYLLLRATRAYLEHDMFLSLEVQTEETIALGRAALARLGALIPLLQEHMPEKNWDFIKLHYQQHSYDDILAKGATRNFNTKPYEKLHRPLKKTYQLRTNFKDVAEQILRINHYFLVACNIRTGLDAADELREAEILANDSNDSAKPSSTTLQVDERVYLGSPGDSISFIALEDLRCGDSAFHRFRLRFTEFINAVLPAPNRKWRQFSPETKIRRYQFLKINFESMVNWRLQTDMLRCNDEFHGRPRFDGVLVKENEDGRVFFAKLLYVFACEIDGQVEPFALILPLDKAVTNNRHRQKDRDLGLYRLRAHERNDACFISVKSIIRGALIADDPITYGDHFVIDVIDGDWFLRCLGIFCS